MCALLWKLTIDWTCDDEIYLDCSMTYFTKNPIFWLVRKKEDFPSILYFLFSNNNRRAQLHQSQGKRNDQERFFVFDDIFFPGKKESSDYFSHSNNNNNKTKTKKTPMCSFFSQDKSIVVHHQVFSLPKGLSWLV